MWSWQQHHGLCDAGFQRCSALADVSHVELATAPRIMRRWFSASLRLGRHPKHVELAAAPRIMRRWFSASLRLGRRLACGAGNSTTDYVTLVFSVAPPWPTSNVCGAGNSTTDHTTDYTTLVFRVAPSWPTPRLMWSWLHEILFICSPTRSSDWQCSGLHYAHLSLFSPV